MEARIREDLQALLGASVQRVRALTGGDINETAVVTLADGREVFVKSNRRAPPELFTCEAQGLAWLRAANAIRIPEVLAATQRFLVLEWIPLGSPANDFDDQLGRALAKLHRTSPNSMGLDHDNFIGSLPQNNTPCEAWSDFYRTRRLEPQLARAIGAGLLPPKTRRSFTRLMARLDDFLGPPEPAARLHGDLWGGNLICDDVGRPCLIDPAVYGGHREIDLAMMRLFGGFSSRVFAAYEEAFPLAPGHAERVSVYQLYPLLVHLNLFGAGYLPNIESALATLV